MKIVDVMSDDLIVGYVPGTVKDALKILAKNNVSGMPVLKKDTKVVVGVITRQDIFKNPDEDQLALLMSKDYLSVEKDQDVKVAAKLLYEHRIHGLPVINTRKQLVGIVSPTDVLKGLHKNLSTSIEKYFTNLVVPIYQETPINIVMEIINITRENALPILNHERKLCGIVSDGDLFKLSHIRESVSMTDLGMGGDEEGGPHLVVQVPAGVPEDLQTLGGAEQFLPRFSGEEPRMGAVSNLSVVADYRVNDVLVHFTRKTNFPLREGR